jgi:hypothetical protein
VEEVSFFWTVGWQDESANGFGAEEMLSHGKAALLGVTKPSAIVNRVASSARVIVKYRTNMDVADSVLLLGQFLAGGSRR